MQAEKQSQIMPPPVASPPERILASPSVRRLAREKGVDLMHVTGSGLYGRIIQKDVLAAATDAGGLLSRGKHNLEIIGDNQEQKV